MHLLHYKGNIKVGENDEYIRHTEKLSGFYICGCYNPAFKNAKKLVYSASHCMFSPKETEYQLNWYQWEYEKTTSHISREQISRISEKTIAKK